MTIITLTDHAVAHIQSLIEKENNAVAFRLSIKKTGCSGYSYVPALINESDVKPEDIHFIAQEGLRVYVDSKASAFLEGVVVDYVQDNAGIKQKRLVYINPHEKNRCGCGESFTIE